MNKYGQAALKAVQLVVSQRATSPGEAWEIATIEIFGAGTSSQAKGCPKNTFLALCETGKVNGVKAGKYTKSDKNKGYAIKALELLYSEPLLQKDPNILWKKILDGTEKSHNSQMNVVLALWDNGLIVS